MKTIASLKGPDFLRACNRLRYEVQEFMKETRVLDLRKVLPQITDDMTKDQKDEAILEQSKKNISAMLDRLLEEKPEATCKLLQALMIRDPEDGDREFDGIDLMSAFLEIVGNKKVLDFLLRLAKSEQMGTPI